jgi:hypothetical protein
MVDVKRGRDGVPIEPFDGFVWRGSKGWHSRCFFPGTHNRTPAPRRRRGLDKIASSSKPKKSLEEIANSIAHLGRITLQRKLILCGKPRCSKFHGPYWYAFWKTDGATRCRYIGRRLPEGIEREPLGRFNIDERVLELEAST